MLFFALSLSLSRCHVFSVPLFVSIAHAISQFLPQSRALSLYSPAVAQRQVVISACGVSFRYVFFFRSGTYLRFSLLLLFVFLFLTSPPPPPPLPSPLFLSHLLAVSLWQTLPHPLLRPSPLTLLPLLMTSFLLLHLLPLPSPNTLPLPLAPIPRLSLRPQDVRRCPVGPEVKPRLSTSHPTRHFDSSISSLCVVCVVLSVGRPA